MELRQLRHLVAIVDHGGFARAAEKLGIGQSTLTESVARLEAQVGGRVLERGRMGVRPTDLGEMLLPRARLIVAEAAVAETELRQARGSRRARVSIGLGKSIRPDLMPAVARQLRQEEPALALTVVEGWSPELYARLEAGDIDFAISAPLPDLPLPLDLRQQAIGAQREAVVAGSRHPLALMGAPTLADAAAHCWLLPPEGNGRIRGLTRVFEEAGISPPTRFVRSDSIPFGIEMLRAGEIVAHGILDVIAAHLPPPDYRVLPMPMLVLDRAVVVTLRRRARLQPVAERCLRLVREAFGAPDTRVAA